MDKILYINTVSDIRIREMSEGAMNKNKHDYSKDYLTFEALENGTFTLVIPANIGTSDFTSMSYSLDDGKTWTNRNNTNNKVTITTPTIQAGNKVIWKGIGNSLSRSDSDNYASKFSSTCNFNIYGNTMSLFYGDDFADKTELKDSYALEAIFRLAVKLKSIDNLILPATTLTTECYAAMFEGCTSLTSIPDNLLPATTLDTLCYIGMFRDCTSLTNIPLLPATVMTIACYSGMFSGCTSLTTVPENIFSHITTLAQSCLGHIFENTGLTSVTKLPNVDIAQGCYLGMFKDCVQLTTVPFDLLPATTLQDNCYSGMFYGCSNLSTAPNLPATTLAYNCYQQMFGNCTSLTTAPELPATTLVSKCYWGMFSGCSNLNRIKALFTTTPSNSYTEDWVRNVAASGTFIKNGAATWAVTGVNGIPVGWTVDFDTEINATASTSELTGNSTNGYNLTTTTNRTYAEIQLLNNEIHALLITFGDGKVLELPATSGFTTNHSEIFLNQGDNFYTQISLIFGIDVSSITYCEVTFNDYLLIINLVTG